VRPRPGTVPARPNQAPKGSRAAVPSPRVDAVARTARAGSGVAAAQAEGPKRDGRVGEAADEAQKGLLSSAAKAPRRGQLALWR